MTVSGGHIICIEDLAMCYLEKEAIFSFPVGSHQRRETFKNRMFKSCLKTRKGKTCQLSCVQLLLASGADLSQTTTFSGWTALMIAAIDGHVDIVKLLLDSGADVNTVSIKNGWSALVSAVVGDHYKCAQLLIQAGADVNVMVLGTVRVKSVLGFAAEIGNVEIIKLLLWRGVDTGGVWATTVTEPRVKKILRAAGVPSLEDDDTDFSLQAQCREVIRQQLLKVPPSVNLFFKVVRLGIPFGTQRYLLYNTTLD